jgi:hypothetical protein
MSGMDEVKVIATIQYQRHQPCQASIGEATRFCFVVCLEGLVIAE